MYDEIKHQLECHIMERFISRNRALSWTLPVHLAIILTSGRGELTLLLIYARKDAASGRPIPPKQVCFQKDVVPCEGFLYETLPAFFTGPCCSPSCRTTHPQHLSDARHPCRVIGRHINFGDSGIEFALNLDVDVLTRGHSA